VTTLNHISFYILHCRIHLHNWWTYRKDNKFDLQVKCAYRWQTVPDKGVVMSCDPLQNFGGCNHITGMAEPKVVKFFTRVGYINSCNRMTYRQQKLWLWSRDCFQILPFVVMQCIARVCQLSYLFPLNFNFRKTSATKFLYVKTSSDIVVATSFLYLMVHRRIAGDVPIYH